MHCQADDFDRRDIRDCIADTDDDGCENVTAGFSEQPFSSGNIHTPKG